MNELHGDKWKERLNKSQSQTASSYQWMNYMVTSERKGLINLQKQDNTKQNKIRSLPLVPLLRQSIPSLGLFSLICLDFISANVWIGANPEFSANAKGTLSNASENDFIAYCSSVEICKNRIHINNKFSFC